MIGAALGINSTAWLPGASSCNPMRAPQAGKPSLRTTNLLTAAQAAARSSILTCLVAGVDRSQQLLHDGLGERWLQGAPAQQLEQLVQVGEAVLQDQCH